MGSVEVGRPCKLTLDPSLLKASLDTLCCLAGSCELASDVRPHVAETSRQRREGEGELAKTVTSKEPALHGTDMELRLTTSQVVLECCFPPIEASRTNTQQPTCADRSPSSEMPPSDPEDREGVLVAWTSLQLSVSRHRGRPASNVCVSRIQLSCVRRDGRTSVMPPVELALDWHRHLPSSPLDM